MTVPLLATKLYIPPLHRQLVPRPHLVARLEGGLDGKLTLVSAPAGFGKTTLLCEWITGANLRVAWISLDENDNDLRRFFAYLVAALRTFDPTIGESAMAMLQAAQPPPADAVLIELINDVDSMPDDHISMRTAPRPEVSVRQNLLVLDDYHTIESSAIHDALGFILDHLPGNLHLVISTRADPPLPLARLRGRGQLAELRQVDLRFTPQEINQFLNQVMGLNLTPQDIATLSSRTEGWAAGLHMAALSIQGRQDISGFINGFTGTNRYILDYLVEEVLLRQPKSVHNFLLQTAILDRMTGSLCDAVTGQGDGQQTLERLENDNLFVVSLDDERCWYRYHRLFSDLLQKQLMQTHPDLIPDLHRRASEWYQRNQLIAPAIEHAISAQDHAHAAELVEAEAEATLMRSEAGILLRWLDLLPDEVVHQQPSLCAYHAWALFLDGRPWDEIKLHLVAAECDDKVISSRATALLAMAAIYQGRLAQAERMSLQALSGLSEEDVFLRSVASWSLGVTYLSQGQYEKGITALEEVVRLSQETGNVMVAVMVLCHLAEERMKHGQMHESEAMYNRALEYAVDRQGQPLPIAGQALIGLGDIEREWNRLDTAIRHLREGIALIQNWGKIGAIEGHLILAKVLQARGDFPAARAAFQEAQQLAEQFDVTELDDRVVALYRARLWLVQGDLEAVAQWIDERQLIHEIAPAGMDEDDIYINYRLRRYEHVVLVRFLIATGQLDEALARLDFLLEQARKASRVYLMIEIHVLRAIALHGQGNTAAALKGLEVALSLAEAGGFIRIFVDEGKPMLTLLRQVKVHGELKNYVSRLLAAYESHPALEATGAPSQTKVISQPTLEQMVLIEPLSPRELQVLRYLVTELTTPEIADELVIAASTVRSHVKSIYSKLGVHNRFEAIDRAREINLI